MCGTTEGTTQRFEVGMRVRFANPVAENPYFNVAQAPGDVLAVGDVGTVVGRDPWGPVVKIDGKRNWIDGLYSANDHELVAA